MEGHIEIKFLMKIKDSSPDVVRQIAEMARSDPLATLTDMELPVTDELKEVRYWINDGEGWQDLNGER